MDCLHSLYAFNSLLSFEVIVVDNHSGDESEHVIKSNYPQVKWLQMGYNAGFARANNAGIKAAEGQVYLLLNPDTLAIDDAITVCYHQLTSSNYVAAGVQLLNEDGSSQISGSFFVKWGLNHLLPIPYWGSFIRWLGYQLGSKVPSVFEAAEVEKVDWINGAFLMVKKEAVEKAGLLDEDFFLYAEEIEWCSRLKRVGDLCILGALKMIHLQGESVNASHKDEGKGYYGLFTKKDLQVMVSNHLRIRKQYGVVAFLFLLINYTFGVFLFFLGSFFQHLFSFQNPFKAWPKGFLFLKNVFKIWGLSPKIIKGKPHFYKVM